MYTLPVLLLTGSCSEDMLLIFFLVVFLLTYVPCCPHQVLNILPIQTKPLHDLRTSLD